MSTNETYEQVLSSLYNQQDADIIRARVEAQESELKRLQSVLNWKETRIEQLERELADERRVRTETQVGAVDVFAKLESERDELQKQVSMLEEHREEWRKRAIDRREMLTALRARIELAPKIMIQRQWKYPGKWPVMDASDDPDKITLFQKYASPEQTRCQWVHAVPVEPDEPNTPLTRAHAVIRDGQVIAMANRADYVEYLRSTFPGEVVEVAVVPVGKEGE